VPILNLGKNGDTTASALDRVKQLTAQNPDIVVISLGGNDGLRRMSPAETESNLQKLIETLTRNGAIVVLLGVPGGLPFNDPHPAIFERLSTLPGVVYVSNILRGLLGNQELMSDPIHPNDAGYAAIADRVTPAILTACAQLSTMTD
jgi:acyl-CoA thioesterase-1